MKRLILPMILVLLMAGCRFAPRNTKVAYAQANDVYITVVEQLTGAYTSGELTDGEWVNDVLPLIEKGDEVLDQLYLAVKAGVNSDVAYGSIADILIRLQVFLDQIGEKQ